MTTSNDPGGRTIPSVPGLTVRHFFAQLQENATRSFLDKRILTVLDAVFGGRISGADLRRVAPELVDFEAILENEDTRQAVLNLLPDQKQTELEARVGRKIKTSQNWEAAAVTKAKDFFGLLEERISIPLFSSLRTVDASYGLFDHQRSAVSRLMPLLTQDTRRAVLHFPTGVGKTRTAMHVVAEILRLNEPSVVVWLASGKELLEQAVQDFEEAWKHLGTRTIQLGTMWADREPDLSSFVDGFLAVSLAKAWAMLSRSDPGWAVQISKKTRLVVFDEAHQVIAPTYRRITEDLTLDYRCALLGLTATPGRTWADIDKDAELADFFEGSKVGLEVPAKNPVKYLMEEGYLARPSFRTLLAEPGMRLSDAECSRIAKALDIPDDIVNALSISEQYVTAVLHAVEGLLKEGHQRILVFAGSVDQARLLAGILAARGSQSMVVTASTPDRVRNRVIRLFRSAEELPRVLVNFGVLTTGFDAPMASAAVIARPTKSLVLYSQMVGRVIRGPKAGGTGACEVITVVDPSLPGFGDVADAFLNWEDVWT